MSDRRYTDEQLRRYSAALRHHSRVDLQGNVVPPRTYHVAITERNWRELEAGLDTVVEVSLRDLAKLHEAVKQDRCITSPAGIPGHDRVRPFGLREANLAEATCELVAVRVVEVPYVDMIEGQMAERRRRGLPVTKLFCAAIIRLERRCLPPPPEPEPSMATDDWSA